MESYPIPATHYTLHDDNDSILILAVCKCETCDGYALLDRVPLHANALKCKQAGLVYLSVNTARICFEHRQF